MKNSIWYIFSLLVLTFMAGPAGCGGGGGGQLTATHFSVSAQGNVIAGTAFNFTVTALDATNNVVTTYSGTVHFRSADALAILPADSKLTNGVGNFSATFKSTGEQAITATDTVTVSITGTSNSISVTGPAASFSFNVPSSVATGTAFSFTVTAIDNMGNVVVGYSGTVHFTSSDIQAVLPSDSKLTNGNLSATLKSVGGQTITATDTVNASITGKSGTITVTGPATHFSVVTSPTARAGTSFNFIVVAVDAANNTAATYSGTVHFTSTDPMAGLPANSALTNGTGNFSATLNTVGGQKITATDTVTATITGTSKSIKVFTGFCVGAFEHCSNTMGFPCCPGLSCQFQIGGGFTCQPPSPSAVKSASRFTAACTMETARESLTATLLDIGLVLVVGGDNGSFSLASVELFDPETRTFAPAGDLATARARHTATSLPNGMVLITGGRDIRGSALASAEILNTETMSFAPASSMTTVRESHTATLFRNGKVLLAGGNDGNTVLASAELFDPQTGSFTPSGSMTVPRSFHTATLLKNGKVLMVGGQDAKNTILASAELFDPGTGRFTPTGRMNTAREFHTATLLEDGTVLIAGGDSGNEALATAELFDPETLTFAPTGNMQQARELHTATLRNDGTVLLVGGDALISGVDGEKHAGLVEESTATAEVFDPSNGNFLPAGEMSNPRAKHTATLLPDGTVIVIGGVLLGDFAGPFFLSSAELFQ